jgi:Multicopper oxidase
MQENRSIPASQEHGQCEVYDRPAAADGFGFLGFDFHRLHRGKWRADSRFRCGSRSASGPTARSNSVMWSGNASSRIAVDLLRGPDIGDFVFHCHVLSHEDAGMMAIIRVQPRPAGAAEDKR